MPSASIVLLAGTEQHSDLARVLNALELVRECQAAGDQVELIFDGAGVSWIPLPADPEHKLHKVFVSVRESIAGACRGPPRPHEALVGRESPRPWHRGPPGGRQVA